MRAKSCSWGSTQSFLPSTSSENGGLAPHAIDNGEHLFVGEDVGPAFGPLQDRADQLLGGVDIALAQPVRDVRGPAHEADAYLLMPADHLGRHTAVNAIRQPTVALLKGLDDCGSVHPSSRAECITPDERIVGRDVPVQGACNGLAVSGELREVAIGCELSKQAQIEQNQFDGRVAHALAYAERRTVNSGRPTLHCPKRVFERSAAIVVSVPVDADRCMGAPENLSRELDEIAHALRTGMPARV